jgi:hypothetical protein
MEASAQQVIPPGQLVLAGMPVVCGPLPTVITAGFNDTAMNNGQAIILNQQLFFQLPPVLQLYTYAHECGHANVGPNEVAADCWAIKTGRNQGWFPPQAFQLLMQYFQNNPGDIRHPSGPVRVQNMLMCYQQP